MGQEYYSFDEVLRELQIEREDLQKIIEEGDIKAYSSGGHVKFLRADIETLRFSKMDQPTIAMHEQEEDVGLIEEIEDEEPAAVPKLPMPSRNAPIKEEQKNKKEFGIYEKSEDGSPLLDMAPEEDAKPLLDIAEEAPSSFSGKEANYEGSRSDIEELVFETNNGDDLLETGELLFESRDQKLPGKRADDFFSDSAVGYTAFDSRESTAYKETVDLSEEGEDIIGTSGPYYGDSLAIDEIKKRQKRKKVLVSACGILAFFAFAFFVITGQEKIEVRSHRIEYTTHLKSFEFKGLFKVEKKVPVLAKDSGEINELKPENSLVEKGDVLACLKHPKSIAKQIEEVKNVLVESEKKYNGLTSRISEIEKKMRECKKRYDQSQKTEDKKKALNEFKRLRPQRTALLEDKKQEQDRLEKMKTSFEELKKRFSDGKETIVSSESGILREWKVKAGEYITEDGQIAEIDLLSPLRAEFAIPQESALEWKTGERISIKTGEKNPVGLVSMVESSSGFLKLTVLVENQSPRIMPETESVLAYEKKTRVLAIPKELVSSKDEGFFVMLLKEGKAVQTPVELGKEIGNLVTVVGPDIQEDASIIYSSRQILKDGDAVVVKNE